MTRKLKTLGVAFVAVFAMSAVVASAVHAGQFTTAVSPAELTGEQVEFEGSKLHVFTAGLRKVSCSKATFTGTSTTPTKSITVTPVYEECLSATFPVTVTMNGCDYLFNEPVAGGGSFTGTVNLECPTEKPVEVHIYTSAANHKAGVSVCTITVFPFKGLGTNTYHNVPATTDPDHVTVTSKITNIPIKIHTESPLVCGTATTSTYTGGTTVKAYKDGLEHTTANQVGATVS